MLAARYGLSYAQVPVVSGRMGPGDVAAFASVIASKPGPYLAYCRSGTRSCHLWAFATVGDRPVEETIGAAAAAGYDLTGVEPLLQRLSAAESADQ